MAITKKILTCDILESYMKARYLYKRPQMISVAAFQALILRRYSLVLA